MGILLSAKAAATAVPSVTPSPPLREQQVDSSETFIQGTPNSDAQMVVFRLHGASGTMTATWRLWHLDPDAGWIKGEAIDQTSTETSDTVSSRLVRWVRGLGRFSAIAIQLEAETGTTTNASAWSQPAK